MLPLGIGCVTLSPVESHPSAERAFVLLLSSLVNVPHPIRSHLFPFALNFMDEKGKRGTSEPC